MSSITSFIKHHYRHFNAAALVDAAQGYVDHLASGGKMFVTIAGAMSTAELGLSLAEMIRQDKIHGICCTGANLEEDVFNLVAHDFYERVPHYRDLTPADEAKLLSRHMNRVTDTCIPEMEAMRRIENVVLKEWVRADQAGRAFLPARIHVQDPVVGRSGEVVPDRSQEQLAAGRRGEESAHVRARLGRLDARQHVRRPLHFGRCEEGAHGAHRHRVHDGTGGVVHGDDQNISAGLLPDWRRDRGRLPDLRGAHAAPGSAARQCAAVGLLLPDQRFDDQLWLLLGRGAQREDHLGQAGREDAEVHHRVGCIDRGAADVCLRAGVVGLSTFGGRDHDQSEWDVAV